MAISSSSAAIQAIAKARHGDPFAILGMHVEDGVVVVRAMLPHASRVNVLDAETNQTVATLERLHDDGFFAGVIPARTERFPYRFELMVGGATTVVDDPYRFGTILGDVDLYLISEGTHRRLYEKLGAHSARLDGVDGVTFAVWAPSAQRVSVVGDFNNWDGRRAPMRLRTGGIWEIFLPAVSLGARYKFELLGPRGQLLPLKADPFAFACERAPGTASIVSTFGGGSWSDDAWMENRRRTGTADAAISVYEVHLGSWQRDADNRYLTYDEIADRLFPYVSGLGFTHIEMMPIAEHPFDGSWGYQPIGMFAPTSRFGAPEDFARFVDRAHAVGLGVIVDWVPGHFPTDLHGLGNFDGTALYEHADPRQGFQPDWNTYIFNFGRAEVENFLIANALFWLREYHVDALRVDAVASMLYLDYSRQNGAWIPNVFGGRENLDAVAFLRRLNIETYGRVRGTFTVAEESTSWPAVSRPVDAGGLGFGYKWNMGWMHDSLAYIHYDPIDRRYHQDELTFTFSYAFSESYILPLSHDEVVYGKGSLIGKMPGDEWQRFANLRAYYCYMFAHPGKKLLFMGGEFAQEREWDHDRSLDWHLLEQPLHRGVYDLLRDLNRLYRDLPALHARDTVAEGLQWIRSDSEASYLAFARRGNKERDVAVVAINFVPVVRYNVRIGVPLPGTYEVCFNSDSGCYGGSQVGTATVAAEQIRSDGYAQSIALTLPPLAGVIFRLR